MSTPTRKQTADATLTALAAITTAADKLIYATGADTFTTTDFTASGRGIVEAASYAAMRGLLGLVIGTDVAAQSSLASYLPLAGGTLTGSGIIYGVGGTSSRLELTQVGGSFLQYGTSSLGVAGPLLWTSSGIERMRFAADGGLFLSNGPWAFYRTAGDYYTNYERFRITAASGSFTLAAESAGTGAADINLILTPAGEGSVNIGGGATLTGTGANPLNFSHTAFTRSTLAVNSATASHMAEIMFSRQRGGSYDVDLDDYMGGITCNTVAFFRGKATANVASGYSTVDWIWEMCNAASDTAERMRFTAEGLLGIGTATPAFRLDIGGGDGSYLSAFRAGYALIGGHSGTDYDSIGYNTKPTASGGVYNYAWSDTACRIQFHTGGFRFITAASGTAGNPITETERLTITQAGNVGIGTSSPSYRLHVNGTIHTDGLLHLGGNACTISPSSSSGFLDFNSNQGIKINPGGAFSTHFTAGGLVGIGTTSPAEKLTVASGNICVATAGYGITIKEGSNARMGIATLVGGTVTVSTTAVTANSRIVLTGQNLGTITVPVGYAISARSAGTDFTILSANVLDTSNVMWQIFEPA